jgi:hypothetical protein
MHPLTPVWDVLMYFVLPLWVVAGFADYLCHRASGIEQASGIKESAIHWLMLAEVGVPLMAVVFLQVNALLLAFVILCLIAHEITGYIDLQVATRTRQVTIFEQQVHSVLEMMPLTAVLLLAILHWPQTLALFGAGRERAEFYLALKQSPAWTEIAPPAIAFLLLAILPYLEEFIRGMRVERSEMAPHSSPRE